MFHKSLERIIIASLENKKNRIKNLFTSVGKGTWRKQAGNIKEDQGVTYRDWSIVVVCWFFIIWSF